MPPKPVPIVQCRTCIFWEDRRPMTPTGECHYGTPQLGMVNGLARGVAHLVPGAAWPPCGPLDWCGRHQDFQRWAQENYGVT